MSATINTVRHREWRKAKASTCRGPVAYVSGLIEWNQTRMATCSECMAVFSVDESAWIAGGPFPHRRATIAIRA